MPFRPKAKISEQALHCRRLLAVGTQNFEFPGYLSLTSLLISHLCGFMVLKIGNPELVKRDLLS